MIAIQFLFTAVLSVASSAIMWDVVLWMLCDVVPWVLSCGCCRVDVM